MGAMFKNANSFNRSLNDWDVTNVKNLAAMFSNQLKNLHKSFDNWNVSNVTNLKICLIGTVI